MNDREPRTLRRDLAVVAIAAIAARALYFIARAGTDSFQLPIVDAELFDKAARAFAEGHPTSNDDWLFHADRFRQRMLNGVLFI